MYKRTQIAVENTARFHSKP